MINSGVITPEGEKILLPFYELGEYFSNVIKKFLEESEENKELYNLFKEDYKTFSPNLDFCLCVLGYKIVNPFLFDNRVIEGNSNFLKDSENKKINYLRSTDHNLKIESASFKDIKEGIIDKDLIKYEVDRENNLHHEQLYETILMQKMMSSKTLYEDYVTYMSNNKENYPTLNSYFRNKLGFIQVVIYDNNEGFILYNSDMISEKEKQFLKRVNINYPNLQMEDEIKKYSEGEENESRRIRL